MEEFTVKIQMLVEVVTNAVEKATKKVGLLTKNIQKATMSNKKFITTMLSVMFAAKQLSSFLNSLLFPAFQVAGVFDVLNSILTVFFLPAALLVLDWLLKIMPVFTNMNPVLQDVVNVFVLFWAAIAAIVAFIAPFALFIAMIAGTDAVAPVLAVVGAAILFIVLALKLVWDIINSGKHVITDFMDFWKTGFEDLKQWTDKLCTGITTLFTGIKEFLTGDYKKGLTDAVNGLKDIFTGALGFIGTAIDDIIKKLLQMLGLIPKSNPIPPQTGSTTPYSDQSLAHPYTPSLWGAPQTTIPQTTTNSGNGSMCIATVKVVADPLQIFRVDVRPYSV